MNEDVVKLEAFEKEVDRCKRFEILGTTPDDEYIRLIDKSKEEGEKDCCVDVPISEVLRVSPRDVLKVARLDRPDIVCNGYTRIVGYYSAVNNWNASKIGEQRDRAKGREQGAYGFNGYKSTKDNEAIDVLDRLSVV